MAYIAVDLLGGYSKTSQGHCYILTIICMLTSFVEVILIEDKKTVTIIKAYLKHMFADKGRSKFVLTDRGSEFSSEVMSYIADQLDFTKVYTSPSLPKSNSIIERCHSFLKNSIRKMRCNHDAEWDELTHIAKIAYIYFPIQLQERDCSSSCTEEMLIYLPCTNSYNPKCDIWEIINVEYI